MHDFELMAEAIPGEYVTRTELPRIFGVEGMLSPRTLANLDSLDGGKNGIPGKVMVRRRAVYPKMEAAQWLAERFAVAQASE